MHHHTKNIIAAGKPLEQAEKVMILVHGRGGSAEDILGLSGYLQVDNFALLAPQAQLNSWYPYSFLASPADNEPGLSSALALLGEIVAEAVASGRETTDIFFTGFSQGACLITEFAARNAQAFGGVFALSGGLIGDRIYVENYKGDFAGTPIFLGCSDRDFHIPLQRVNESTRVLADMNAWVTEKIYPHMGHTIIQDEIDNINQILTDHRSK